MSEHEIYAEQIPTGKYLVDPYESWARAESIPVVTGPVIDLLAVPTQPWPRFGVNAALCHLDGRCDFLTVVLTELPPNSRSLSQRHLYEEVCYVLSGRGITEIELPGGETRSVEWGPRSQFTTPMNASYHYRNVSNEPARFAAISDLRYLMGLYRNEDFIFGTDLAFPERHEETLSWDLLALELGATDAAHVRRCAMAPADGSIATDVIEMAPGSYGMASRQIQGTHIFGIHGEGYTLVWDDEAGKAQCLEWRHGVVCAAAGMLFHQHFNCGSRPARYLEVQLGSQRYPMFRARRSSYGDKSVYAAGSATISYADQDAYIHSFWLEKIRGKDIQPLMR